MKNKFRTSPSTLQIQRQLKLITLISVGAIVMGALVFVFNSTRPEKAFADTCEVSYSLNWADTTTWDVDCGKVNAGNWSVIGKTCTYYSPVYTASGTAGDPNRVLDIDVRINQSGNLDNNDTAWVFLYVNGAIKKTYTCMGDSVSKVFIVTRTINVPAGGTFFVSVRCKNDRSNELWQIKNGDVTACLRAPSTLPVTLVDFKGSKKDDNTILLEWMTLAEVNNNYFTIERSSTGDDFKELTRVEGAGNSTSPRHYQYTDLNPSNGYNYYRLTQTDFDGTTEVFKTIGVKSNLSGSADPHLKVYPNPFSHSFKVEVDMVTDCEATVKLISPSGAVVYSNKYDAAAGANTFDINISKRVANGTYFLQITDNNEVIASQKVICRN